MTPFRLSVLDQSPIPEGSSAGDALRNTLDLARAADRLGYTRYWLAEHHASPGLACASPEVIWILQFELMDYRLIPSLTDPTQWHFDANLDFPKMCMRMPCD